MKARSKSITAYYLLNYGRALQPTYCLLHYRRSLRRRAFATSLTDVIDLQEK